MTLLHTTSLVLHVLFGVSGVIASYAVLMELLRRQPKGKGLKQKSVIAFVFYLLSWLTGGFYYLQVYGAQVKPLILAGPFPWAHSIFTETKEHIFIFLPFLALVTVLALFGNHSDLAEQPKLKKSLVWFVSLQFAFGVFISLAGFIMSGAVR